MLFGNNIKKLLSAPSTEEPHNGEKRSEPTPSIVYTAVTVLFTKILIHLAFSTFPLQCSSPKSSHILPSQLFPLLQLQRSSPKSSHILRSQLFPRRFLFFLISLVLLSLSAIRHRPCPCRFPVFLSLKFIECFAVFQVLFPSTS